MIQLKIFANYRYQSIEDEFNGWAAIINPYIVKTILSTTVVPRIESGHSIYFTLAIFYNEQPEILNRSKEGCQ